MLKVRCFDAKAVADNMVIVNDLARLPFTAFGPGTDKGDTRALPEIWKEADAFKASADKMQAEVAKLPGQNYEFSQPIQLRFNAGG